ncbi:MAG: hypothetical protein QOF27_3097 [Gaiellaceae bacterium]|nr:hypothetical protein [Gaiellaceae bacterium]
MGLPFTRSCALALVVVACGLAAAPALASDEPSAPTATAASDTTVELSWTWPASPVYPDELDVIRNGVVITNVSLPATRFLDTGLTPGTTYHYQLQTYTGSDPGPLIPATPVDVTTRDDFANPPTNVHASFGPGNVATVTWTRGASDADVLYQVKAQPSSGGSPNVRTVRYAVGDSSPGSLTMDGFASYTSYTFTVSAIEDGGPTIQGDASASATSLDTLAPQFNGGIVTAVRGPLGTITATWSSASDAGTGVAGYAVCVDVGSCTALPVAPGSVQTADIGNGTIRNDGLFHSVAVFAVDGAGNQSAPISTSLQMPIPATPVINLSGPGNGCAPLIVASVVSSDSGSPGPQFHLLVDGVPTPIGELIGGAPYQQVTLVANATFGADTSAASDPIPARVYDPDGPDVAPQVHGKADPSTNTETLTWDPVMTVGAPIIGYKVTSSTIPGFENGIFVAQSAAPQQKITGLEQSQQYNVQVTAVDGCLRESVPVPRPFRLDDNLSPTPPVLNAPVPGGHDVSLSWAPSSDNVAVDDYKIYQDGALIARTNVTSYFVNNLPDAFTAQFTVVATDTAGNQSAPSAPRSATTKDLTAPTWPLTGLFTAAPQGGNVTLRWPAANDKVGVSVYQLMRDGVPIQNLAATTFVDKGVPLGGHHYEVRAFDAAGNGSTAKSVDATSDGPPRSIVASALRVVKTTGKKMVSVGGKQGTRIVLSFKLTQTFAPGVLRLNVIKSKATGKAVTKVRISLPARTGSTAPGKRIGERIARKGTISIPLGKLTSGTLRLVVTATAGTVTLSGTGAGSKAPTIVSSP